MRGMFCFLFMLVAAFVSIAGQARATDHRLESISRLRLTDDVACGLGVCNLGVSDSYGLGLLGQYSTSLSLRHGQSDAQRLLAALQLERQLQRQLQRQRVHLHEQRSSLRQRQRGGRSVQRSVNRRR